MSDPEPRNPLLAVDVLIRYDRKIVLVKRKNPPRGWALPGGFVETGETIEEAARREMREETSLTLENLRQWRAYSDPDRDPRQHVVSVCFKARGKGSLRADTDAASVRTLSLHDPWPELVFDHRRILEDYVRSERIPALTGRR
jgi:8-oxo-dGTP diphosphatase